VTDWIRQTIAARAETLGLTAYAVAQQCDPPLDPQTVKRFLSGRCRLNSEYVGRMCRVLRLTLRPSR